MQIGIAYGTEKRRWLTWCVNEFEKTSDAQQIKIKLIPMGSLEGAHAVLDGNESIHVWSPASSMYRDVFVQEWQLKRSGNPIAKEEILALTPMVFVFWKERADAFRQKYQKISFQTISEAIHVEGGWGTIAEKPEWGLFKFGHTHPNESNSGLMSLVLTLFDYHQQLGGLSRASVIEPAYQKWLTQLERGVSGLSNSTGNMMKEMVLKGPSSFDGVMVYESVAIDFLQNAEGRWGQLAVAYPEFNMWNDNPYYILDTPWTDAEHKQAAEVFLQFLMSEAAQKEALVHGFRPGNPSVAIKFPESPFVKYQPYGLRIELTKMCQAPPPDVLNELSALWSRAVGR